MKFTFGKNIVREKSTLISYDSSGIKKLEYKFKGVKDKEREMLEYELYNKINLNFWLFETTYNIEFNEMLLKEFFIKILVSEILEGYKNIKDVDELFNISRDILNKIFRILKDNNILNPSISDITKILDNMKVNTIQDEAMYYYEDIIKKEKK